MNLTARETKNKILADMTPDERSQAIVGETLTGYVIVTDRRVFDIYMYHPDATEVLVKGNVGDWEDYE